MKKIYPKEHKILDEFVPYDKKGELYYIEHDFESYDQRKQARLDKIDSEIEKRKQEIEKNTSYSDYFKASKIEKLYTKKKMLDSIEYEKLAEQEKLNWITVLNHTCMVNDLKSYYDTYRGYKDGNRELINNRLKQKKREVYNEEEKETNPVGIDAEPLKNMADRVMNTDPESTPVNSTPKRKLSPTTSLDCPMPSAQSQPAHPDVTQASNAEDISTDPHQVIKKSEILTNLSRPTSKPCVQISEVKLFIVNGKASEEITQSGTNGELDSQEDDSDDNEAELSSYRPSREGLPSGSRRSSEIDLKKQQQKPTETFIKTIVKIKLARKLDEETEETLFILEHSKELEIITPPKVSNSVISEENSTSQPPNSESPNFKPNPHHQQTKKISEIRQKLVSETRSETAKYAIIKLVKDGYIAPEKVVSELMSKKCKSDSLGTFKKAAKNKPKENYYQNDYYEGYDQDGYYENDGYYGNSGYYWVGLWCVPLAGSNTAARVLGKTVNLFLLHTISTPPSPSG